MSGFCTPCKAKQTVSLHIPQQALTQRASNLHWANIRRDIMWPCQVTAKYRRRKERTLRAGATEAQWQIVLWFDPKKGNTGALCATLTCMNDSIYKYIYNTIKLQPQGGAARVSSGPDKCEACVSKSIWRKNIWQSKRAWCEWITVGGPGLWAQLQISCVHSLKRKSQRRTSWKTYTSHLSSDSRESNSFALRAKTALWTLCLLSKGHL